MSDENTHESFLYHLLGHILFYSSLSFYTLSILWNKHHPIKPSPPFLDHSFPFLNPCVFFSFHSIYWSDGVTSWLPGGRPAAPGVSPGGGWVKCRCGGWFPLMKYQYFTWLICCRLTKHDTILSKLGNVDAFICAVLSPCDDKKRQRHHRLPLHYVNLNIIIYYAALQRQRAVKEKLRKNYLTFIGWQAN